MKNSLIAQVRLMVSTKTFKAAFSLVFVLAISSYLYHVFEFRNTDITQMKSSSALFMLNDTSRLLRYFETLFPVVVVFPFVFSYADDTSLNMFPYLLSRQGKKSYYISKYMTTIIGAFMIIFIPLLLNLILTTITFPLNNNTYWGGYNSLNYEGIILGTSRAINTKYSGLPFVRVFFFSPIAYNLVFLFISSLFASSLASFTFAFSMFFKKYKVILLLPAFLLLKLFKIIDAYNYAKATTGSNYINYNFMSYIEVSGYTIGKYYFLFLILMIILFLVGYVSVEYRIRRNDNEFIQ